MEKIYFEVQGIGRVHLVQECGANLVVEDESGTRLSLPASRCVRTDQTAAALADQFTGEDLGAEMAAAERDVNEPVTCRACYSCHRLHDEGEDGDLNNEVGKCYEQYGQGRALDFPRICSDFKPHGAVA